MARINNKVNNLNVNFKQIIQKLWKTVPPKEWLDLLQELSPENEWALVGQAVIKAKCPYHQDKNPSFTMTFQKGIASCFGASIMLRIQC